VEKLQSSKGEGMERTLVIIKPDGVQRGLIGPILTRLERRGLRFAALKLIQITPELAARHYAVHEGKPFYEPLIQFITSGPVVVAVIEGKDAIDIVRKTMGATSPAQAEPGTIRADFGLEIGRNLVHGSDGPETAAYEIPLFFEAEEILSYQRAVDGWLNE
jgi:nucleoside-diphosphate kinase